MAAILAAVTALFTGLFNLITGILVPSAITPLTVLIWFGLLGPAITFALSFVFSLARGNRS